MRRIDEVMSEIKRSQSHTEIAENVWVPTKWIPYPNGIFTLGYWRVWWRRIKDAWQVLTGYAEAIDWGQGRKH